MLFLALDFFEEAAVTSLLSDPHVLSYLRDLVRACVWLLILSVVFIPLEMLFPLHKERTFRATTPSDLGFYFLSTFLPPFVLLIPVTVAAYFAFKVVPAGWRAEVASWPIWLRALAAFVVGDLGFYWGHRWAHRFPLLWRFSHSVHHDPKHVYFSDQRARPSMDAGSQAMLAFTGAGVKWIGFSDAWSGIAKVYVDGQAGDHNRYLFGHQTAQATQYSVSGLDERRAHF